VKCSDHEQIALRRISVLLTDAIAACSLILFVRDAVERRRRYTINDRINELASLLPTK